MNSDRPPEAGVSGVQFSRDTIAGWLGGNPDADYVMVPLCEVGVGPGECSDRRYCLSRKQPICGGFTSDRMSASRRPAVVLPPEKNGQPPPGCDFRPLAAR